MCSAVGHIGWDNDDIWCKTSSKFAASNRAVVANEFDIFIYFSYFIKVSNKNITNLCFINEIINFIQMFREKSKLIQMFYFVCHEIYLKLNLSSYLPVTVTWDIETRKIDQRNESQWLKLKSTQVTIRFKN